MTIQLLGNTLSLFAILMYTNVAASVYRARAAGLRAAWLLVWIAFLGIISAITLLKFSPQFAFLNALDPDFSSYASLTWLLILTASFLPLLPIVYSLGGAFWIWTATAAFLIFIYAVLPGSKPIHFLLVDALALGVLGAALFRAGWKVWTNQDRRDHDLNRIYHALAVWLCLLTGSLVCIIFAPNAGQVFLAGAVWMAGKALARQNFSFPLVNGKLTQPAWFTDSREMGRILPYVMFAVLFALAAQLIILIAPPLDLAFPGYGSVLAGLLLAAVFTGVFHFIQRNAPRLLPLFISTAGHDTHRIMREFSVGIGNVTNPATLATISIGLIREAVENESGILFEVDHEPGQGGGLFRLTSIGGIGQFAPDAQNMTFSSHNPLIQALKNSRNSLTMTDIKTSANFSTMTEHERAWFLRLNMALFIPVHTRESWIGLIALDEKTSGRAYQQQDLDLICTLADQLSLALQNARLIDSLMRVNNDFRRAYTSMEQSNRQLQQAVFQLEKMDRTKSDFISVSSHELRTPLTVMRGYAEMLRDDPVFNNLPAQEKMIQGIYAGIMRLNEVVESMLDLAAIDARSLELNKQAIAIYPIIHAVCHTFAGALQERKIKLTLENLRDLPMIDADAEMVGKVFTHLVTNAIKYTPDNGSITISGVVVSPGQMGFRQGAIEIVLADTGIGIDPSNLDLIFRKFYQTGKVELHSSGKTKFKGSGPGLGLAIAKGIVDAHQGKIWAESKGLNEQTFPGSQFHVVLPQSVSQKDNEKPEDVIITW